MPRKAYAHVVLDILRELEKHSVCGVNHRRVDLHRACAAVDVYKRDHLPEPLKLTYYPCAGKKLRAEELGDGAERPQVAQEFFGKLRKRRRCGQRAVKAHRPRLEHRTYQPPLRSEVLEILAALRQHKAKPRPEEGAAAGAVRLPCIEAYAAAPGVLHHLGYVHAKAVALDEREPHFMRKTPVSGLHRAGNEHEPRAAAVPEQLCRAVVSQRCASRAVAVNDYQKRFLRTRRRELLRNRHELALRKRFRELLPSDYGAYLREALAGIPCTSDSPQRYSRRAGARGELPHQGGFSAAIGGDDDRHAACIDPAEHSAHAFRNVYSAGIRHAAPSS